MEDRAAYGTSVDLPTAADQLPSVGQLQALTQHGSEYAVALRHGRALSLRLQPSAEPLPRCMPATSEQTGFVSGGAKARIPHLCVKHVAVANQWLCCMRQTTGTGSNALHIRRVCFAGYAGMCRMTCSLCRCASSQGLGLQYARQLVASGCRTLVLVSRTATLSREALEEFAIQGVAVFMVHADSGDATATMAVLTWAQQHLPAITHHAHASGVTEQTLLKVSI